MSRSRTSLQTRFSRTAPTGLKAAITDYIGDDESGGVSIGETLYHQQLPARLYTVPGVLDFDIYIGTSPDDLQQENIKVDSRSKVVTEERGGELE